MGLTVLCWGRVFSSMLSLVINTYYTGKIIKIGYWKQMGDILPIFCLGFFMFIVVQGVLLLFDNLWIQLVAGGLIGVITYIGLAFLLKFEELKEAFYLIKR